MSIINGSAMQGATRGFYPKTIEGSLRFNDDDSAYLSATHADGGEATYTLSLWAKRSTLGISDAHIFGSIGNSGDDYELIRFNSSDQINWQLRDNTLQGNVTTNAVFRDTSAWYHLVFYRSGSTVKIYVNGVEQSITTGTAFSATTQWANNNAYEVRFGVRTDNASGKYDGYLAEVFFIDGTAHNADAFGETKNGVWVPKNVTATDFTMGTNGFHLTFQDDAEVEAFNTVLWRGDGATKQSITGMGFQPDLVWVKQRSSGNSHILFDAVRGFGNGNGLQSQNTAAEGTNDPSYGFVSSADADGFTVNEGTVNDDYVNASGQTYVGWAWDAGANNAVTGHSSVTYTGSSSTQKISGFPFRPDLVWIKGRSDAYSSRIFDSVRGADKVLVSDTTAAEFDGGGTTYFTSFDSDGFNLTSNISVNGSSKTYVAWGWDAGDSDPVSNNVGSIPSTVKASTTNGFSIVSYTGNGSNNSTVGHGLSSTPDLVLVTARDFPTATNWAVFHSSLTSVQTYLRLNTADAEVTTDNSNFGTTEPTSSVMNLGYAGSTNTNNINYIMYCWHNVTGKQKFGSYTGNGSSLDVSLGFRAGWVMIKRTDSTDNWYMFDASRDPFGMTRSLYADASSSEGTSAGRTVTVDADSMVLGSNSAINASGATYIYAAFAGSYSDYITDYNTDGSIDSRVKASDTTGFSIVSYVGTGANATVGHGLSSAPDWIIFRDRDTSNNWGIFHTSLGATHSIKLNVTDAAFDEAAIFNDTAPTSSVISLGNSGLCNSSGNKMIAYCWAEKTGYSKFGSYTGNGGSSTVSVTTGFKPAFVITKETTSTSAWTIMDGTRSANGVADDLLYGESSQAEDSNSAYGVEFTSTGFTIDHGWSHQNENGQTYIYAAFADTREAAFWLDQSGNDNDWQPVNLDHNDTLLDSPTDNFATFNPLAIAKYNATGFRTLGTFSDGNLTLTTNADNESGTVTFGASSGKYYMEFTSVSLAQRQQIIVYSTDDYRSDTGAVTTSSDGSGNATDRVSWTTGDVIGIAVDIDSNKVWFHKNGDWFGTSNPSTPTGGDTLNAFTGVGVRQDSGSTGNAIISFNAGQQPFKYDPPA